MSQARQHEVFSREDHRTHKVLLELVEGHVDFIVGDEEALRACAGADVSEFCE